MVWFYKFIALYFRKIRMGRMVDFCRFLAVSRGDRPRFDPYMRVSLKIFPKVMSTESQRSCPYFECNLNFVDVFLAPPHWTRNLPVAFKIVFYTLLRNLKLDIAWRIWDALDKGMSRGASWVDHQHSVECAKLFWRVCTIHPSIHPQSTKTKTAAWTAKIGVLCSNLWLPRRPWKARRKPVKNTSRMRWNSYCFCDSFTSCKILVIFYLSNVLCSRWHKPIHRADENAINCLNNTKVNWDNLVVSCRFTA